MAQNITKLIILSILFVVTMKHPMLIQGQQQVPCLYFFGDSQVDNGNNNLLSTTSKVNYLPYGMDYPDGPTGRFTNGRNVPDFIAEFLGFDKPIPPFATASGSDFLRGVNYGSGGSGILNNSGRLLGDRIPMNGQLQNHGTTVSKVALLQGNATLARDHLNKCLYVVNIGANDYLNNYLLKYLYRETANYTSEQFANILIKQYSQQLRSLYKYGARKTVVFSLGQVGCTPQERLLHPSNGPIPSCFEEGNNATQSFNDKLVPLIDTLNTKLPFAQFILINSTSVSTGDALAIGTIVANRPCCSAVSKPWGLCVSESISCSNRNEYVFWDNFHPTENFNHAIATRAYSALLPSDAYPVDIRHLVEH